MGILNRKKDKRYTPLPPLDLVRRQKKNSRLNYLPLSSLTKLVQFPLPTAHFLALPTPGGGGRNAVQSVLIGGWGICPLQKLSSSSRAKKFGGISRGDAWAQRFGSRGSGSPLLCGPGTPVGWAPIWRLLAHHFVPPHTPITLATHIFRYVPTQLGSLSPTS